MPNADKENRRTQAEAFARSVLEEHEQVVKGVTTGRCMWPFLPSGVRAVPADRLPEVGSVAVYRSGGALRAHRVVAIFDGGVFTRSDRPGAPLERVYSTEIVGVWEGGAGLRNLFLRPRVGSMVARMSMALSRPAPLKVLRSVWRGLPTFRPPLLDVGVFMGKSHELAEALTLAGLNPRVPSLEELESTYLCSCGGFAVLAKIGTRPFGAAAVRVTSCEVAPKSRANDDGLERKSGEPALRGFLSLGVRRYFRRAEVLDALLHVTIDEAVDRGFFVLESEARQPLPRGGDEELDSLEGLEAAALRRHGFERADPEHRRVPSTGQRIALYRWLSR